MPDTDVNMHVWDPIANKWVAATVIDGSAASSTVSVDNFPATQPVSGSVAVSNLPATQAVSGTVGVNNFPATQPVSGNVAVSGSVAVSNLPATQPVSGSVAVSNLPATQPVSGTVGVNNFPATQPVSGTVAVNNLPGTQPVSGTVAVSSVAGNVTVVGGSTLAVSQAAPTAPTAAVGNALSAYRLVAAATTNANLIKSSAARVYTAHFTNVSASAKYIKLFNKATAPVTGTDTPIFTILVPAGGNERLNFGTYGKSFGTGLGIAITSGPTDLDNTAVAANDVYAHLDYL